MPTLGVRLRGLFDEAWRRARRRRILLASAVACAVTAVALAIGPRGSDEPRPASPAHAPARAVDAAAPRTVAADDNVPVTFTAQHDTGVVGRSGHGYAVSAMAVAPAVACVNNRDAFSPDGTAAGSRMTLTLAVRQGEGGNLGWCPGSYRGTIAYTEDVTFTPDNTTAPALDPTLYIRLRCLAWTWERTCSRVRLGPPACYPVHRSIKTDESPGPA